MTPSSLGLSVLAQPMAQLVRHCPGGLVGHPLLALLNHGRDATLVAAHQIGGEKPLRESGARAVKHRPRGHRFLAVAGRAFVDPRPRLKLPRLPRAASGTDNRPANACSMPRPLRVI